MVTPPAALALGAMALLLAAAPGAIPAPEPFAAEGPVATATATAIPGPPMALRRGGTGPVWLEREAWMMGTRLGIAVRASSRDVAVRAIETAFGEVERWEAVLSTWRPDTDVAELNRSPVGRPVPLSQPLFDLLAEVRHWTLRTGGVVDPAVGPLVDAWDLRGDGRVPDASTLARALAASGSGCFRLEPGRRAVTRACPGGWIDTGAFGKGAALRDAGRALEEAGIAASRLDFGGQLLLVGTPPEGGSWRVGVAHPARRDEPAATLSVPGGSVATTSSSERFVEVAGERFGHVLDPRTGRPVPFRGSVTVVEEDPLTADLLSTALFVMGPRDGSAWAQREGIAALYLVPATDGRGPPAACPTSAMIPFLAGGPAPGRLPGPAGPGRPTAGPGESTTDPGETTTGTRCATTEPGTHTTSRESPSCPSCP